MIILNKKRLTFITYIIILTVVIYISIGKANKDVQTVALPVSNKTIIIDARTSDPLMSGAESKSGLFESEINLKIALKLQNLLEQSGTVVILTRHDEFGIYELDSETIRSKKVSDLKNRVKIGNESRADLFISIHLNKIPETQYSGWQTFYGKGDENAEALAKSIQKNLNETIDKENNRESLVIKDKYIIENINIPTVIVECGFLSNYNEEKQLRQDEYQNRLAWGIYSGIIEYFY